MTISRLGNRKEKKRTKYNVRLNRFLPDKSSLFRRLCNNADALISSLSYLEEIYATLDLLQVHCPELKISNESYDWQLVPRDFVVMARIGAM